MNKLIPIGLFLLLFGGPFVLGAVDFNRGLTPEEEQQFDQILAPVMKIYTFVKYAATIIGVLAMVFAGLTFITAGGEQMKKEKAKNMAIGVIIGLGVIWVAPLVVRYIFT